MAILGHVRGITHHVANPTIKEGPTSVLVGVCKAYAEGYTVLLTLDPDSGHGGVVEVALVPEHARKLAERLVKAAEGMERQRAKM